MSSYEDLCKKMHSKANDFAKYLKELNDLNTSVIKNTEKLVAAFEDLKGKKSVCSVCYTRKPTHVFLECGHCFCQSCAERGLARNKCFICRATVNAIIRVYI